MAMLPGSKWIEIRQKQNGEYRVHYPDPGFIPCAPACDLQRISRAHKHDYVQGWIEAYYHPTDLEDAMKFAALLAEGREVKLLEFVPLAQRRSAAIRASVLAAAADGIL